MAASLNLIDNVMVGQMGDVSIAGVGLGNQIFFVLQLFLIGAGKGPRCLLPGSGEKRTGRT